jgi:TolA-binding protein
MKLRIPRTILLISLVGCSAVYALSANAQNSRDNQLLYELLQRIELLEQELRQLRGDFELLQYQQQGQQAGTTGDDTRYQTLEKRLQRLEQNFERTDTEPLPASESSQTGRTFSETTTNNGSSSSIAIQSEPASPSENAAVNSLLPPIQPSNRLPQQNGSADL